MFIARANAFMTRFQRSKTEVKTETVTEGSHKPRCLSSKDSQGLRQAVPAATLLLAKEEVLDSVAPFLTGSDATKLLLATGVNEQLSQTATSALGLRRQSLEPQHKLSRLIAKLDAVYSLTLQRFSQHSLHRKQIETELLNTFRIARVAIEPTAYLSCAQQLDALIEKFENYGAGHFPHQAPIASAIAHQLQSQTLALDAMYQKLARCKAQSSMNTLAVSEEQTTFHANERLTSIFTFEEALLKLSTSLSREELAKLLASIEGGLKHIDQMQFHEIALDMPEPIRRLSYMAKQTVIRKTMLMAIKAKLTQQQKKIKLGKDIQASNTEGVKKELKKEFYGCLTGFSVASFFNSRDRQQLIEPQMLFYLRSKVNEVYEDLKTLTQHNVVQLYEYGEVFEHLAEKFERLGQMPLRKDKKTTSAFFAVGAEIAEKAILVGRASLADKIMTQVEQDELSGLNHQLNQGGRVEDRYAISDKDMCLAKLVIAASEMDQLNLAERYYQKINNKNFSYPLRINARPRSTNRMAYARFRGEMAIDQQDNQEQVRTYFQTVQAQIDRSHEMDGWSLKVKLDIALAKTYLRHQHRDKAKALLDNLKGILSQYARLRRAGLTHLHGKDAVDELLLVKAYDAMGFKTQAFELLSGGIVEALNQQKVFFHTYCLDAFVNRVHTQISLGQSGVALDAVLKARNLISALRDGEVQPTPLIIADTLSARSKKDASLFKLYALCLSAGNLVVAENVLSNISTFKPGVRGNAQNRAGRLTASRLNQELALKLRNEVRQVAARLKARCFEQFEAGAKPFRTEPSSVAALNQRI